jgi:predicted GH43/DUF377 family glycosyl hydrolase
MPRLNHCPVRLAPDARRVVIRPFHLGSGPSLRSQRIVKAVSAMDARTVQAELALVNRDFEDRHWQTRAVFLDRFQDIKVDLGLNGHLSIAQKELIGAYFCHEYSYAAAALMNPSVVAHPDQSGLTPGYLRILMSLRAVGEGHISSIAFREGILGPHGQLELLPQPPFAMAARAAGNGAVDGEVLATRQKDASLSGTVIFPMTPAQSNGLEDLRLVRFQPDDGPAVYYGTYTAYNGKTIASELMETDDFHTFSLKPLSGSAARNKGMALFPRKVNGQYAVIGRQDGENLWYLTSDDLMHWEGGEKFITPKMPWELVQMGNCGSPMEIDEGWLLLTHGVGAMRKYAIGAVLLDKDDPRKVIGRLETPLVSPEDEDREGYVPNVVYTCGGLVHGRELFLPYGVADSSVAFAWVNIGEMLKAMV